MTKPITGIMSPKLQIKKGSVIRFMACLAVCAKQDDLSARGYTKSEIRKLAHEMDLKPADTPDSQEICFVPNNNYRDLIKQIRLPGPNESISGGDRSTIMKSRNT
ncbi:MAG: hypothetical protein IPM96_14100 [Ignavibacteria bacterium]|nr:hypothetical protein [Ignavibacteria bacterium]